MSVRGSSRNASGAVLPTRLMVLSVSVVALAGLVFFATQGDDDGQDRASTSVTGSPTTPPITDGPGGPATAATPTPVVPTTPAATPKATKTPVPVNKAKTEVLILNNTNRTGFAGMVRTRAERFGWNVINTGNWQGSVDGSTVYYGPGMKEAAKSLAADLKIKRIKPLFATNDLSPKRLNIILTDDYS